MADRGALADSLRELAESIVDAVREPLVVLDAELRVLFLSRAFEQAFQVRVEDAAGVMLSEITPALRDATELGPLLRNSLHGEQPGVDLELEMNIPRLGPRWMRVGGSKLTRQGEGTPALLITFEDVTAVKDAMRAIELQRDSLRILLDVRIQELAETTSALSAEVSAHHRTQEALRHANRLSAVGRLTAGLAHELGTPLNVVAARAKLIATDPATSVDSLRHAEIVEQQAARMTRLIRRLLGFSRQNRANEILEDAQGLVEATATLLEPLARKRGVQLEVQEGAATMAVDADGADVEQVLTNLIVNAIDAQPKGGRVLLSASVVKKAGPAGDGTAEYVCLAVNDRGPGIPDEVLPRIFEPFFTTKDSAQGTGLGLSVCKNLVEESGGWIEVESSPEHGTQFRAFLPTLAPTASQ